MKISMKVEELSCTVDNIPNENRQTEVKQCKLYV